MTDEEERRARNAARLAQGGAIGLPGRPEPLRYGGMFDPSQGYQAMPSFGGFGGGNTGGFPGYGNALKNVLAPPAAVGGNFANDGPAKPAQGGLGGALKGVLGGVGGAVGDAANWLTDKDQGYLRQLLLSNVIGTAGSIYEANKRGSEEDEEKRRKERVRTSYGPALQSVVSG